MEVDTVLQRSDQLWTFSEGYRVTRYFRSESEGHLLGVTLGPVERDSVLRSLEFSLQPVGGAEESLSGPYTINYDTYVAFLIAFQKGGGELLEGMLSGEKVGSEMLDAAWVQSLLGDQVLVVNYDGGGNSLIFRLYLYPSDLSTESRLVNLMIYEVKAGSPAGEVYVDSILLRLNYDESVCLVEELERRGMVPEELAGIGR